jgi:hypothetical protein
VNVGGASERNGRSRTSRFSSGRWRKAAGRRFDADWPVTGSLAVAVASRIQRRLSRDRCGEGKGSRWGRARARCRTRSIESRQRREAPRFAVTANRGASCHLGRGWLLVGRAGRWVTLAEVGHPERGDEGASRHSERSAEGAEARNRDRPGRGPSIGTSAIPHVRRFAPPLGMTAGCAVLRFCRGSAVPATRYRVDSFAL